VRVTKCDDPTVYYPDQQMHNIYILHDHHFELGCTDVLGLVGDPLTERRLWFIESHLVLVIFFLLVLYLFIYS